MSARLRFVTLALLALAGCSSQGGSTPTASSAPLPPVAAPAHPDFSGFWNLDMKTPRDPALMALVPPNTVFLDDTGPVEFPAGNFGGLILTPAAQAAVKKWNPRDQLTPENACRPPSIVYALQGPFPIEIFQSDVFIVMKLEYYDLVRIIFLDGRKPEADYPHSMTGFSSGHWEGSTLVVETTHLEPATITNNGLNHTENIKVIERFRLSPDGQVLMATQEYEDPAVIVNRGVRFIAWRRQPGQHVFPYECDPGFAGNYKAGK
ncbi:MAG TPA: hypothetical protein VMC02_08880 [Steroidobacteraceae bacterium]|nr:hypothetical protein [Steroidobacteraceae bacterium]